MLLVNSCLLGLRAKYNGGDNTVPALVELCRRGLILPACPEQLGGLPTPRPAAEIRGGSGADVLNGRARVVNCQGEDVTGQFIQGAREVLKICHLFGIRAAILKERSPSCGGRFIHDGTFQDRVIPGRGVTAALLQSEGIRVFSEEQLSDELLQKLWAGEWT
ncbi:DUF523 domain-containing protein [Desulfurispora thermophila]|uniref:DUF523 domain-containing protein n=1 Tax=Desulfurispora thermophila TaxID=265470 RepID=UPI0003760E6B|nr:DUF523 domain-containing protein [Desulfurispora thermophila]